VACDGLKGLPDALGEIWPQATVQLCVVHLARASLRYASKKYWASISKDLREIYTASSEAAAGARFAEFEETWGQRYPAIIRLWRSAWEQFIPFLAFPPEVRRVIYTTNAIESLNARFRQATRRRGHFPTRPAMRSASPITSTWPSLGVCRKLPGFPRCILMNPLKEPPEKVVQFPGEPRGRAPGGCAPHCACRIGGGVLACDGESVRVAERQERLGVGASGQASVGAAVVLCARPHVAVEGYALDLRAGQAGADRHRVFAAEAQAPDLRLGAPAADRLHGFRGQCGCPWMAAGVRAALEDQRRQSPGGQFQRRGKPGGSRADDQDLDSFLCLVIRRILRSAGPGCGAVRDCGG
jgi:hypothetical protein